MSRNGDSSDLVPEKMISSNVAKIPGQGSVGLGSKLVDTFVSLDPEVQKQIVESAGQVGQKGFEVIGSVTETSIKTAGSVVETGIKTFGNVAETGIKSVESVAKTYIENQAAVEMHQISCEIELEKHKMDLKSDLIKNAMNAGMRGQVELAKIDAYSKKTTQDHERAVETQKSAAHYMNNALKENNWEEARYALKAMLDSENRREKNSLPEDIIVFDDLDEF